MDGLSEVLNTKIRDLNEKLNSIQLMFQEYKAQCTMKNASSSVNEMEGLTLMGNMNDYRNFDFPKQQRISKKE